MNTQDVEPIEETLAVLEQAAGLSPGQPTFELPQVAKVLRLTTQTVRRHIRAGKLQALAPNAKRRLVTRASVLRFLQQSAGLPASA